MLLHLLLEIDLILLEGVKKKTSGEGILLGKNSSCKGVPLLAVKRPKFHHNISMSNHDLIECCNYSKIPINNVLSRDQKVPHKHKLGLFIYNLEPSYMDGSHWVATYVKDNTINYFDHAKKKKINTFSSKQSKTRFIHYHTWILLLIIFESND